MSLNTRAFENVRALVASPIVIAGRVYYNNTDHPTSTVGNGFTVTRTGAGVHLITLGKAFPKLVSAQVSCQVNGTGALVVRFGAIDETAGTIEVLTFAEDGGGVQALADVAAHAQSSFFFTLLFRNSSRSFPA